MASPMADAAHLADWLRTCLGVPVTQRLSEYETQIECPDVNQLPFPNILPASQIHPAVSLAVGK
jgi:hypothetical protein